MEKQLTFTIHQLELEKVAKEKAERKAFRINKFTKQITVKERKLEWIYIATTSVYAAERIFKIGSTTRLSTRINGYNTGRPIEDAYHYCWVVKCYNAKDADHTETVDLENQDVDTLELIKQELSSMLTDMQQRQVELVVDRKILLERLGKITNEARKNLWTRVKEFTGWTTSKAELSNGSLNYKIIY